MWVSKIAIVLYFIIEKGFKMIIIVLRWLLTIVIAIGIGKIVSKFRLPSILGWLIAGIILGPHAVDLMPQKLLDATWYCNFIHVLECAVGLMIGTELVWSKLRKYGKALIITTLVQSLGTFAVVSLVFAITFKITGVPLYLAFIFGGIALATAPAPALSIVHEFKTSGPVTQTLIPMAALDDIVGVIVFFTTIAIVGRHVSGSSGTAMPIWMIPVMVFLPLIIGAVVGIPTGFMLRKDHGKPVTLAVLLSMIVVTSVIGFIFNTYVNVCSMTT